MQKPLILEAKVAESLHLVELWRGEGALATLRTIGSTLWAEWSDCVTTMHQIVRCASAAYTEQDGTNHLPGQRMAHFQNLSPKCDFIIFELWLLLLSLKNISETVCATVAIVIIVEEKTHLMTACLQRSSEIELSLVMGKYSYIWNMQTSSVAFIK